MMGTVIENCDAVLFGGSPPAQKERGVGERDAPPLAPFARTAYTEMCSENKYEDNVKS